LTTPGEYEYDWRGRRVKKTVNSVETRFIYDMMGNEQLTISSLAVPVYISGRRIMKDDNTMDYPWMYYYDNKGRMTISRSTVSVDIGRENILFRCEC
jgi:uncharacterized protein RhaS with RHS repeats